MGQHQSGDSTLQYQKNTESNLLALAVFGRKMWRGKLRFKNNAWKPFDRSSKDKLMVLASKAWEPRRLFENLALSFALKNYNEVTHARNGAAAVERKARMCRPFLLKWFVCLVPVLAVRVRKNPVTRVTDLLERLKEKVEQQGADEAKLWEKMQCNCKETAKNLQKNIEQEETRLPILRSDHSNLGAQKARLVAEKERAVADRADAQKTLASAQELRPGALEKR
eukprot:Skav215139  [mRNA]  locus=scaffold809:16681:20889:+ [translate_table: standard]